MTSKKRKLVDCDDEDDFKEREKKVNYNTKTTTKLIARITAELLAKKTS